MICELVCMLINNGKIAENILYNDISLEHIPKNILETMYSHQ